MDAFAKLPDAIAELVAEFSSTPVVGDLNVGLTQYSLWLLIAGVVLLAVIFAFVKKQSLAPKGFFVNGVEWVIEYVEDDIAQGVVGFVWVIEVFSLLLRLVTLAVRLFCNMFAGHIVMGSFAIMASIFAQPLLAHFSAMNAVGALPSVAWVLILLIIYAVELIVAFVQAYVFTVLSAVYIQIAEADAH